MTSLLLGLALAHAGGRLEAPVTPTAQAVHLTLSPSEDPVHGTTTIALRVDEKVSAFSLHGEELEVSAAVLRRGRREVAATVTRDGAARLTITPDKPLKPGAWELDLVFESAVRTQPYGLYRFTTDEQDYLVTQLEADDARTVFPCFDEPSFKVPLSLTVTAPVDLAVVANGPVASRAVGGDQQTVTFATTPPIPTYAMAVAVGPYEAVPVDGMPVPSQVWVPAGHQEAAGPLAREMGPVTAWLEDWFGDPYPYAKLDFIASTDFSFGAMENPGAVVIAERILYPASQETPGRLSWLTEVTAHEIGHMWFGNLVTMDWWDDFWLNESFAKWIGSRATAELHPELGRDIDVVRTTQGVLGSDGTATARPLRTDVDPTAVFETANFAVYPKGEAVLTMVEAWLGRDVFQEGVRRYLQAHRWGNATAADLMGALSEVSGEDVAAVMLPFLDQPGAPLLDLQLDDGTLSVSQSRYARLGAGELEGGPWRIPLQVRVGRPDGTHDVVTVLVTDAEQRVDLGEVAWVLPTADGIGYVAWSLPEASWTALLDAFPALSTAERVAVLGDLDLLIEGGHRSAAEALATVEALSDATDPEVIDALLDLAGFVGIAADLEDEALEELADAWTRQTLRPLLDAVGVEARADEPATVSALRRRLLGRLADAGDEDVRARALTLAQRYLEDADAVHPDLVGWAMGVWVEQALPDTQADLLARALSATNPRDRGRWLTWHGAVRGEEAVARSFDLALSEDLPFGDMFSVLGGLGTALEDDEARVPRWIMANHEAVSARLPPQFRMYLAGVGGGCDLEFFEESKAFFSDPSRQAPGVERVLAETEARVSACVTRRETHGASVRAFLSSPAE